MSLGQECVDPEIDETFVTHFVMGAYLSMLWCFERLFLKSSSGRKRYNVLGAYSVKGH